MLFEVLGLKVNSRCSAVEQLLWYSQVKKLVKNRVQGFELHLGALTPSHGEQMVRTQLHDDKWVAEA